MDGKVMRGTLGHAKEAVKSKENEITAATAL